MELREKLDEQIASRHLLNHPFYQRWSDGTLTREELQEYARQYWHFTAAFPTFVSGVHANVEEIAVRQFLLENLIEEERGEENHPELWLRFCEALGLSREEVLASTPNNATADLIRTMRGLTRDGQPHEGLASLYAYESQVPAVAKAKIEGLATHFGISSPRDVTFFSVHQEADVYHSQTEIDILDRLCDSEKRRAEAQAAAASTTAALYGFLDAVTAAPCEATAH
jgi:pyrroloquinoline-quinone synthase